MKKLIAFAVVVIIGFFLWSILPTTNCCNEGDAEYREYDALVVRATTGDSEASRLLYKSASAAGHVEAAKMWARNGAMNGADDLIKVYVEMYKNLPENLRESEEKIILKTLNREGARRLVISLGLQSQTQPSKINGNKP